jgi:hypothetical protein
MIAMVVLGAAIFAVACGMWIGIPWLWLYLGSLVQAETDNVGAAIGAMIFGVTLTIALTIPLLGWLNGAYQRARVARGLEDTGSFPLEVCLTLSAFVAIAFIIVWFAFLGGAHGTAIFQNS